MEVYVVACSVRLQLVPVYLLMYKCIRTSSYFLLVFIEENIHTSSMSIIKVLQRDKPTMVPYCPLYTSVLSLLGFVDDSHIHKVSLSIVKYR